MLIVQNDVVFEIKFIFGVELTTIVDLLLVH